MFKFMVVLMIGIVLAIDIYGFVKDIMVDEIIEVEVDHIDETTITVYVE